MKEEVPVAFLWHKPFLFTSLTIKEGLSLHLSTALFKMKSLTSLVALLLFCLISNGQQPVDSASLNTINQDSILRIINLNPYFTLHVDSTLSYRLEINKEEDKFYWYLKNPLAGLRLNKDNGLLTFKAEKSLFITGKLKYDTEYKIKIGVQSLTSANEKIDTGFTIVFYNTEVIPSRLKPTLAGTQLVQEGDSVSFSVLCETGNFPIEDILFTSSIPIIKYSLVKNCGDEFLWVPNYDFVKETDSAKVKIVNLSFIGSTKFKIRDTANVRIIVQNALNYPQALEEHRLVTKNVKTYTLQLKYAFLQLDRKLKRVKTARTTFDLTSATTALTGTLLNTSNSESAQKTGKILPSVGVAMVPIKEASAPNKTVEQNQASLIRASIKRLEYMISDNVLVTERDPDIAKKTSRLKEELKQSQMQLIDVPVDITTAMTEEELNNYFNNPKVNKKYRLKQR